MTHASPQRHTRLLVILAFFCAFSFGALVSVALAGHYHVNCVGHGFVHGDNTNDGSFFARVEYGCSSGNRNCSIYTYGNLQGNQVVGGSTTCNLWSNSLGSLSECGSSAHVGYAGLFATHIHYAHNWCG